ncbi:hypothetical protein Tmar_0012 [Thermaerobacter marianensis DSM 12885]|uniref:DUF3800 domain-containing protein n=1 Tax=Thermaerobacter marianensis (strain ATCC 700841 / DSM 12885 / JCM 10246 / 7p75a) TaxID=644966 RepID=E6SKF0_THEM7|nr:DUF3800 domain-containing protein [Thermaerobacter marianensis]ADU50137.1 hypothetical protein Tmar_0012 [Thermaerobacter marianensis DSM 12885]
MAYKTSEVMEVFLDESGALRATEPFYAGLWITWQGDKWRTMVSDQRAAEAFFKEFHFHKISRNPNDWRYRFGRRIARKFIYKNWYARLLHVPGDKLDQWRRMNRRDIYDTLLTELLVKFAPHIPEPRIVITIDERNRPKDDDYLPVGIEAILRDVLPHKQIEVRLASSSNEDLLQVVDLLVGAVRQLKYPSGNQNKKALARLIQPYTIGEKPRVWVWDWS